MKKSKQQKSKQKQEESIENIESTTNTIDPIQQQQHQQQPPTSTSSSHQTLSDQVYSPNSKTISTSPSTEPEFISPTKSLKTFFFSKNRLSSYSIDSISEEPELNDSIASTTTPQKKKLSIPNNLSNNELSPSKSPRILNFNLKPKFIRSKSSIVSDSGGSTISKYPVLQNNRTITIDDFADTDSSDESFSNKSQNQGEKEIEKEENQEESPVIIDESFNSVLQEYINRESESRFIEVESRPNSKILSSNEKEILKNLTEPQPAFNNEEDEQQQSALNITPPQRSTSILNQPSPTSLTQVGNRNSGNSITSLRFKVSNDKVEPIKTISRHMSTSTNIDINRSSSLRASMAFSDDSDSFNNNNNNSSGQRLPDPTITPLATPRGKYNFGTNSGGESDKIINSSSSDPANSSSISNDTPIMITGLKRNSSLASETKNNRLSSKSQIIDETMINKSNNPNNVTSNTVHTFTFDETILKSKHTSMGARSSMSSGELLRNLENSYEITKSSGGHSNRSSQPQSQQQQQQRLSQQQSLDQSQSQQSQNQQSRDSQSQVSTPITQQFILKAPISSPPQLHPENNMTAGIDQTNELPIMLYKVHDKDFDESKNRWSVYENRNSNTTNISKNISSGNNNHISPKLDSLIHHEPPSSASSASASASSHISSSSSSSASYQSIDQLSEPKSSNLRHPEPSYQSHQPQNHNQNILERNSLVLSQPKRNIYHETPKNLKDLEKQLQNLPYLPKQQSELEENTYKFQNYSNLKFGILMILGLIIPPIYFLIPIGLFDDNLSKNNSYYGGGLRFYNKSKDRVIIKRFTKWQKITSFIFGILWVSVILAMIGVGLGIGLTRE
ncbi:uncharacterized protein KGF55_004668 [Candida pseudojiufengensis]|uniref:uncharacterized protein n=1 Tax=Candida pseudojiufengensis TaxID=497109 RepID=UPI00222465E5|nr:uncharacterized protein KGF55_004668 [Candida pseudojiufengensis]KAI5960376.1 hypothetical protein KGF55_004668 [Candida pseudojiufengensis]